MKILKKTLNQSIENSLMGSYYFDNYILNTNKKTGTSYEELLFSLAELNDISVSERKMESFIKGEKHFAYVTEILVQDESVKGIKNFKKNVDMGKWVGKELLYFLRDFSSRNKAEFNYLP